MQHFPLKRWNISWSIEIRKYQTKNIPMRWTKMTTISYTRIKFRLVQKHNLTLKAVKTDLALADDLTLIFIHILCMIFINLFYLWSYDLCKDRGTLLPLGVFAPLAIFKKIYSVDRRSFRWKSCCFINVPLKIRLDSGKKVPLLFIKHLIPHKS